MIESPAALIFDRGGGVIRLDPERRFPGVQRLDRVLLSFRLGLAKPGPALFRTAVAAAGAPAARCFYTDDVPECVAAARAVGLEAVQFRDAAALQAAWAERGILADRDPTRPRSEWERGPEAGTLRFSRRDPDGSAFLKERV